MLRCASSIVTAAYPKYASFLGIRAPCLRPFYEVVCKLLILRLFTSSSLLMIRKSQTASTRREAGESACLENRKTALPDCLGKM